MAERVRAWLEALQSALQERDARAASELFHEDECFWRDLVAFTWNIYTAESREEIRCMLEATLTQAQPSGWEIDGEVLEEDGGLLQAFIKFETQRARGKGHVKLRGDKCWCLLTTMQELKGHEEKTGANREVGVQHGPVKGRKTWADCRREETQELGRSRQPYCLIVGGGQAGVSLAARLRRLGVPALVLEKKKRIGDTWRDRYRTLYLHSPVWYTHLPYMPFPDDWPVYAPKDRIGDWLEAYAQAMGIVCWTSAECKKANFNEDENRWEVRVDIREGEEEVVVYPKHLVLATGMTGLPNIPTFKGQELFQGVQLHSTQYTGGHEWAGKRCVVVGANNSAHDICADLWECGAAMVTMLQRSPTLIVRHPAFAESHVPLYCADSKYSTQEADLLAASIPHKLFPRVESAQYRKFAEDDKDFYKELAKVGFMQSFGEDDSGLFAMYYRRASGFYVDVGASELVIRGEIKLKSGISVEAIAAHAVKLRDGSQVEADLIVYATGYRPMNEWAGELISPEVADRVGKCWGLGSGTCKDPGPWERELRNMWKPTSQQNLWFHGGSFEDTRHFSLYLALQLKARMEAIPTPLYGNGMDKSLMHKE